jgi:2-iminobutanoate/2-iminopropanoate deaminase
VNRRRRGGALERRTTMRSSRTTLLIGAGAAAALAFAAGIALGAGAAGPRRLNLPGAGDRPFSHVVDAGGTLYLAGTLGLDPATRKPPADAKAEARLALDDLRRKLELAGATMDDLVWVQVFCPDLALYDDFNAVYRTYFERGFPARSFIGSGPLLFGSRFEINAIAVKG